MGPDWKYVRTTTEPNELKEQVVLNYFFSGPITSL